MKELSIEDKAKAYDEAVEKLRSLHDDYDTVSTLINIKEELENIFPELKESEDERIRKALIDIVNARCELYKGITKEMFLAWLEKQGEHANFHNNIQVGDKVTRNEDGVLVNLSQLKRIAKKDEKQGEQKPVWSEEDERIYQSIMDDTVQENQLDDKQTNWLNSLKDRYTWKPSDRQMKALKEACDEHWEPDGLDPLYTLWEQLKKLMEE